MSVVLLDTCVASLLHPRKKQNPLRMKFEPFMRNQTLALSFQRVAELLDWAENNNWGVAARTGLDQFINRFLLLPFNYPLAKIWARVMTESRKRGRRLSAGDCWIASTAILWEIPLLTMDSDLKDQSISGMRVICP